MHGTPSINFLTCYLLCIVSIYLFILTFTPTVIHLQQHINPQYVHCICVHLHTSQQRVKCKQHILTTDSFLIPKQTQRLVLFSLKSKSQPCCILHNSLSIYIFHLTLALFLPERRCLYFVSPFPLAFLCPHSALLSILLSPL